MSKWQILVNIFEENNGNTVWKQFNVIKVMCLISVKLWPLKDRKMKTFYDITRFKISQNRWAATIRGGSYS